MSAVAAVAARGGQAFFLDTAQAFSARRLHDMLAYMLPRSQVQRTPWTLVLELALAVDGSECISPASR